MDNVKKYRYVVTIYPVPLEGSIEARNDAEAEKIINGFVKNHHDEVVAKMIKDDDITVEFEEDEHEVECVDPEETEGDEDVQ